MGELLLARAEPTVTREERVEKPTRFVAEINMSRRRRRTEMSPFDALSCESCTFFLYLLPFITSICDGTAQGRGGDFKYVDCTMYEETKQRKREEVVWRCREFAFK